MALPYFTGGKENSGEIDLHYKHWGEGVFVGERNG